MRKALVTGGNGFIGKHLIKRLKKDGYEVFKIPHENLKSIHYLSGYVESINPTHIFHLSAFGNMTNQTDEDEILQANIINTYNLLQATKNIPYSLFVNFSTSSVYGKVYRRMKETYRLKPDTLYAATKASAEYLCRYFRKKYQKVIVTIRPFSVYGPGEADFRFIPTLINNDKKGKITNVIQGTHDWIYIDDFIEGVIKVVENAQSLPHRTFNIGSGVMTNNSELAYMVTDKVNLLDERKIQDSEIWVSNTYRLRSLNWRPKWSLSEGVKKVYESTTSENN